MNVSGLAALLWASLFSVLSLLPAPSSAAVPILADSGRREVMIIDAGVTHADILAAAVRGDVETIRLKPGGDAFAQVAALLRERHDLAAIHLVSHGAPGRLLLGDRMLSQATLALHAEALRGLGEALQRNGALLLYGCEVGQGSAGQAFLNGLAASTGHAVAASTGLTGDRAQGGDWELEVSTSSQPMLTPFNDHLVRMYPAVLALANNGTSGAQPWPTPGSNATLITTTDSTGTASVTNYGSTGFDLLVKNSGSITGNGASIRSNVQALSSSGGFVRFLGTTPGNIAYAEIRANQGIFDLTSIKLGSGDTTTGIYPLTFSIQALDSSFNPVGTAATSPTQTASVSAGDNWVTFTPSGGQVATFTGIYGVRITQSAGIQVNCDTITVNNPRLASTAPTITSPTVMGVTGSAATLGGNITSDGGATVTVRGAVYSLTATNSNPQIGGSGVTNVPGTNGTGTFAVNASGLTAGAAYSYAAYATNASGTSYTTVGTFTTQSNIATLSNLTLSSGTLAPAFASGTTSYTATVTNATSSITLTPTTTQGNAAITVNGSAATSGTASGSVPLNVGSNAIPVVVTSQDGTVTVTYTVTVTRAAAAPTITTPTSASITGVSATLGGNVTSDGGATVTARGVVYSPTATNSNPQISGSGVINAAGTGTTGVFTVNVSSLTAGTAYSYAAYATNSAGTSYTTVGTFTTQSNVATLSNLVLSSGTLSPIFASGTTTYTASVTNATSSITVMPTATQANATIKVNTVTVASGTASGSIALSVGANTITTVVTAQDGTTTQTYTVTVTRQGPPTITTPTSATITGVAATLGGNVTSDGGATVTARGVVYSPTATNSNPQISGSGVINTAGTGTTGVFTVGVSSLTAGTAYSYAAYATNSAGTSYTMVGTFTTLSNNANLSGLTLSNGTLDPVFASAAISYAADVAKSVTSVTATPTKAQAGATLRARVNGGSYTAVTSGVATGALNLILGANPVEIEVTAEDGTTVKVYTVTVTRLTFLQAWRKTYYGSIADAGDGADLAAPKFDGIPNLIKFATGMVPTTNGISPTVIVKNGSTLEFSYPRSVDATTELTYIVEWSETLLNGSWSAVGVTESITSATATLQQVKALVPAGSIERRFIRLRVTQP